MREYVIIMSAVQSCVGRRWFGRTTTPWKTLRDRREYRYVVKQNRVGGKTFKPVSSGFGDGGGRRIVRRSVSSQYLSITPESKAEITIIFTLYKYYTI